MTTQTAARNGTLVYKVSEALRKAILDGEFLPGEKLPSEARLTQEHGVSRTVVREAVAALRSDGLVEPRQGAGVFVLDPIAFAFRKTKPTVDSDRIYTSLEILEARTPLEIEAAGLAALRRSPAQEEEIFERHAAGIAGRNDGRAWSDADIGLHLAIAKATNNPLFATFLEMQGTSIIPQTGQIDTDEGGEIAYRSLLIKEHERIVFAISNGDEQGARDAMREHLKGSLERYRSLLREERVRHMARLQQDSEN
ncbi:UNVERIFIED_ORG: GntR family transcriptional regulator [Martelella mediterranea]